MMAAGVIEHGFGGEMSRLVSLGYMTLDLVADGLRDCSEHKTFQLMFVTNVVSGRSGFQIRCRDCDRLWRSYVGIGRLLDIERELRRDLPPAFHLVDGGEVKLVERYAREVAQDFARAVEQPCWADESLGRSAEWVTMQVLRAGPRGIELTELVARAGKWKITPADRTLWLLRHLGFTPPGLVVPAVIRMPKGHPLRAWEQDEPHPRDGTLDEGILLAIGSSTPWFPV